MSEEDEMQSSELQKLISDGMTAVCTENDKSSQSSQHQSPTIAVDITDVFLWNVKVSFRCLPLFSSDD